MMSDSMTLSKGAAAAVVDPSAAWADGVKDLMHALVLQRRSAMVLSEDAQAMEWVALQLSRSLRHSGRVQMEMIHTTGTEGLLSRFNALLEKIPVAKARQDDDQPLTLWVLNLRRELELPEVRLLLNLVQGFPGAGVRLLILCTREAAAQRSVRFASTWGSRLHRWVIPAEDADSPVRDTAQPRRSTAVPEVRGEATRVEPPGRWAAAAAALGQLAAGCSRLSRWVCRSVRVTGWNSLRLRWGVGGLVVSLCGAAATWFYARLDPHQVPPSPQRRAVPEVVELLEDVRPAAVRQEQRS